ncbi:MAG: transcriptional activator RfaH [Pseudomonadota bacterium]
MSEHSNARWYVASTQPSREKLALQNLKNQDFQTFLPLRRKTVRHARKLMNRSTPFFPGYVFIRMDAGQQRWRPINGTLGVRQLILSGNEPQPVPFGVVERLQDLTDETGHLDFSPDLEVGSSVRVLSGPFADLVGKLDRYDGAHRVRVLLSIMNGEVPVLIDDQDVAPTN